MQPLVDADGRNVRDKLTELLQGEAMKGDKGAVCFSHVRQSSSFSVKTEISKVLPLQCYVARCIVKNRLLRHLLPPRMREFVALHDPTAVRNVLWSGAKVEAFVVCADCAL